VPLTGFFSQRRRGGRLHTVHVGRGWPCLRLEQVTQKRRILLRHQCQHTLQLVFDCRGLSRSWNACSSSAAIVHNRFGRCWWRRCKPWAVVGITTETLPEIHWKITEKLYEHSSYWTELTELHCNCSCILVVLVRTLESCTCVDMRPHAAYVNLV